ncbi:MAG: NfeD family protein [Fibrobacterota bacterium]
MEYLPYIIAVAGGLLLIAADIVFIPGAVFASAGIVMIIGALYKAYADFGPLFPVLLTISTLVISILGIYLFIKTGLWKRAVHSTEGRPEDGWLAHKSGLHALRGKSGTAFTNLRPSGRILIDGSKIDAVTVGDYIKEGEAVEVTGFSGAQLKVKKKTDS